VEATHLSSSTSTSVDFGEGDFVCNGRNTPSLAGKLGWGRGRSIEEREGSVKDSESLPGS